MLRSRTSLVGGLLLVALVAAPVRGADIDKFIPEDTEIVVTFNVKQLLDSATVKKIGLDKAKDALKDAGEVADILKSLGFDPFKDLDYIISANPASIEQDKGLVIAHGNFDLAKVKAKAEEEAKANGESLKIHKSGNNQIYEVRIPDQDQALFVAFANKETLLASPGKDYVVEALKKESLKKNPGLKNKQMQAMIEKMDAKQTLSIAMVAENLAKTNIPDDTVKAMLAKVDAVSGGFTVTDEIKMEIGVTTKTAADAKDISKDFSDGVNQLLGVVALLAGTNAELTPVVDFIKSIKCTAKDKSVIIKANVSAEAIEKATDALNKKLNKKDF